MPLHQVDNVTTGVASVDSTSHGKVSMRPHSAMERLAAFHDARWFPFFHGADRINRLAANRTAPFELALTTPSQAADAALELAHRATPAARVALESPARRHAFLNKMMLIPWGLLTLLSLANPLPIGRVTVVLNVAWLLLLLWLIREAHSLLRATRRLAARHCPDCDYHLAEIPNALTLSDPTTGAPLTTGPRRCPECGTHWPLIPPPEPKPEDKRVWHSTGR